MSGSEENRIIEFVRVWLGYIGFIIKEHWALMISIMAGLYFIYLLFIVFVLGQVPAWQLVYWGTPAIAVSTFFFYVWFDGR
jgi:hypothetical protein